MSHYEQQYEQESKDNEPACIGCGAGSPISNTSAFGWICDDCLSEYERIDGHID